MCTSASERATAGERGGDDGGRRMKTRTENLGPKEHEGAWHGDQYRIHTARRGTLVIPPFFLHVSLFHCTYLYLQYHAIYVHDGMVPTNTYIGLLSSEKPSYLLKDRELRMMLPYLDTFLFSLL
jgi:hypothetical protein